MTSETLKQKHVEGMKDESATVLLTRVAREALKFKSFKVQNIQMESRFFFFLFLLNLFLL